MPKSDYLRNRILDHELGGPDYVRPATVYVALYTAAPTPAGGGTEVSGAGYARAAVANTGATWGAAAGGLKSILVAVNYSAPAGAWGVVTAFGLFDAPAPGGNLLRFGNLTTPRDIPAGAASVSFAPGELNCTES